MARRSRAVIWSANAERDIDEIWDYLEKEASTEIADEKVRDIARRCEMLARHPFAGRPRSDLIRGMRSILANPYAIFYRVNASNAEIVRVLHQRRDVDAIFAVESER